MTSHSLSKLSFNLPSSTDPQHPSPFHDTTLNESVTVCDEPEGQSSHRPSRRAGRSRSRSKSIDESSVVSDTEQVTITSSRKSGRRSVSVSRVGNADSEAPGVTWSDLEEIKVLGGGVSGLVKLCKYKPTGKLYAVKGIPVDDNGNREMFLLEAEVFENPTLRESAHLVKYLNRFWDSNAHTLYLVLELMDRGCLESVTTKYFPDGMKNNCHLIASIAYQMLCGILLLHRNNMLHRDLKPANVLINSEGEVKLGDFGLLVQVQDGKLLNDSAGSLPWKSPERHVGGYFYPSDIWSFGLIIYYLVTGREAFPNPVQIGFEIRMKNERPTLHGKTVPGSTEVYNDLLADFIDRATAYDVQDRWTADQLLCHPFITTFYNAPGINTSKLWPKSMQMTIQPDADDDYLDQHGQFDPDDEDGQFVYDKIEYEPESPEVSSQIAPPAIPNLQINHLSFQSLDDQSLTLSSPGPSSGFKLPSMKLPSMALSSMKLPSMALPSKLNFDDQDGFPISPIKSTSVPERITPHSLQQADPTHQPITKAATPEEQSEAEKIAARVALIHQTRAKLLRGDDGSSSNRNSEMNSSYYSDDDEFLSSSCESLPLNEPTSTLRKPAPLPTFDISDNSIGLVDPTQHANTSTNLNSSSLGFMKLPDSTHAKLTTPKLQVKRQEAHLPTFLSFADDQRHQHTDPAQRRTLIEQKQRKSIQRMIFDDYPTKSTFTLPTKPLTLMVGTGRTAQPQQPSQPPLPSHSQASTLSPIATLSQNMHPSLTGTVSQGQSHNLPHKSYNHHQSTTSPQSYPLNIFDYNADSDDDLLDSTQPTRPRIPSPQSAINPHPSSQSPHKRGYHPPRYSIDHPVQREEHPFQTVPSPHSTRSNRYNQPSHTLKPTDSTDSTAQSESRHHFTTAQHCYTTTASTISTPRSHTESSHNFLLPSAHSIINAAFTPVKQRQHQRAAQLETEQQHELHQHAPVRSSAATSAISPRTRVNAPPPQLTKAQYKSARRSLQVQLKSPKFQSICPQPPTKPSIKLVSPSPNPKPQRQTQLKSSLTPTPSRTAPLTTPAKVQTSSRKPLPSAEAQRTKIVPITKPQAPSISTKPSTTAISKPVATTAKSAPSDALPKTTNPSKKPSKSPLPSKSASEAQQPIKPTTKQPLKQPASQLTSKQPAAQQQAGRPQANQPSTTAQPSSNKPQTKPLRAPPASTRTPSSINQSAPTNGENKPPIAQKPSTVSNIGRTPLKAQPKANPPVPSTTAAATKAPAGK